MKIIIIGTGAVGGYYGAKLAMSGNDVTFFARGRMLDELQANKLHVSSYQGDFSIHAKVIGKIEELSKADLIILCVKSYDTDTTLEQIAPLASKETLLLSLQNGVESEQKMSAKFGADNVLGAVCYIGAEVVAPGKIVHSADGQVCIGELDGKQTERLKKIATLFGNAGIAISTSDNIQRILWKKLLWNAPFNQVCTITHASVGELLDSPEMKDLLRAVGHEVVALAQANEVDLTELDIENHIKFSDKDLRAVRPSMLQDLEKGKRLEHETFGGFIVREGKRCGIPTPVNEMLYRFLCFLDPGK